MNDDHARQQAVARYHRDHYHPDAFTVMARDDAFFCAICEHIGRPALIMLTPRLRWVHASSIRARVCVPTVSESALVPKPATEAKPKRTVGRPCQPSPVVFAVPYGAHLCAIVERIMARARENIGDGLELSAGSTPYATLRDLGVSPDPEAHLFRAEDP